MIAYNTPWLKNLKIAAQAEEAHSKHLINKDELLLVKEKCQAAFYSPNIFVRSGLFLLTIIIPFFSFGLIALLFMSSIDQAIAGLSIFFSLVAYSCLEFVVKSKKHYRSGVDDALLWIGAGCLFVGISYLSNAGDIAKCLIALIISLYGVLRFTDRGMTVIAFISVLAMLFFIFSASGNAFKTVIPFVLMAASAIIYFLSGKSKNYEHATLYYECLQVIAVASLLSFYFSGNYFIVRELSDELFHLNLTEKQIIPFGWLFWAFTIATPLCYIARGIQKKDVVLIRVGLLLISVIIITVKYYFNILSTESIMVFSGITLFIAAYGLMKYLKKPAFGFTYQPDEVADDALKVESLIIAETCKPAEAMQEAMKFGGGNFGGGGSSGEF